MWYMQSAPLRFRFKVPVHLVFPFLQQNPIPNPWAGTHPSLQHSLHCSLSSKWSSDDWTRVTDSGKSQLLPKIPSSFSNKSIEDPEGVENSTPGIDWRLAFLEADLL